LNPHHHGWYDMHLGRGQFALGDFAQARRTLANVAKSTPEYPVVRVNLAAALAAMGRRDEARAEIAKLLELNAGYELGNVAKSLLYKDPVTRNCFLNALRMAELPD
ncbi:MAG: tetratricopeptide repeat protein, partial [Alphaproteobacteria bacterium]